MRVRVVNAGSSSVKLSLIGDGNVTLLEHELAAPRAVLDSGELRDALGDGLADADAVGHRMVHGGEVSRKPVLIDAGVQEGLRELIEMAPLHQPKSLAALDAVSASLPGVPAVACFDTAFHATLSPAAYTYALPARWRERWAVRRYGFHGLSHAWVARRAPQLLERDRSELRIVSCHLGAGASLCAIAGGRSVDTTMGFTPLEGLVMATRSGSVDPGLMLWLIERTGMAEAELAASLEHESGLLGLAGTADMREVVARAESATPRRASRSRSTSTASAAASRRWPQPWAASTLVFTGGVGENNSRIRASAAAGLTFLGVGIDDRLTAPPATGRSRPRRESSDHAREDLRSQVNRLLASDVRVLRARAGGLERVEPGVLDRDSAVLGA